MPGTSMVLAYYCRRSWVSWEESLRVNIINTEGDKVEYQVIYRELVLWRRIKTYPNWAVTQLGIS